jgi:hypothetical protein
LNGTGTTKTLKTKITSIFGALACTFVAGASAKTPPEDRVLIIRVRDANDTTMKNNRNAKSGQRELNEGY